MGEGDVILARAGLVRIALPVPFGTGTVNAYLHRGDALTLIDTGANRVSSQRALEEALAKEGVGLADLERIVVTHHHGDHAGLAAALVECSGAVSCGHPDVEAYSRIAYCEADVQQEYYVGLMLCLGVPQSIVDAALDSWNPGEPLGTAVTVTESLNEGAHVEPFRVHLVAGHSPTDVLLVNEEDGYTLVGDHLLPRMTAVPALQQPIPGRERGQGLVAYCASLMCSDGLALGWCCPGHGEPFSDHRLLVAKMMKRFENRSVRVLDTLSDVPHTPFEVAQRLHPRGGRTDIFASMSASAGHLEWLVSRGLASLAIEDGIEYYRRTLKRVGRIS